MTAKQFQASIDRLGLSQVRAAKLFRADPRTARRWARGSVPETVAILIRLMLSGKLTADDIRGVH